MSVESDEREFRQYLDEIGANNVEIGDIKGKTDYFELVSRAALLASEFGMGASSSFSDFLDMVKCEDPVLINTLTVWVSFKYRKMYGDPDEGESTMSPLAKGKQPPRSNSSQRGYVERYETDLFQFAKEHGHNSQELVELEEKVKSGQIDKPNEEFKITSGELESMDSEEFQGLLTQMNKYAKKVPNVKLNFQNWKPMDGGVCLTGGKKG